MVSIKILKTGITNLRTDALVNAANEDLYQGSGVCGAIFQAAGARMLTEACRAIGHCHTGSAVITPGFNLYSKYIIHAVGPIWLDGKHKEPQLLYNAYMSSLMLAAQYQCRSIGFPLISSGIYGFPVENAWTNAIEACLEYQWQPSAVPLRIEFAVIDDHVLALGNQLLAELG